ncbi:nicotinate phosphoribosyltransferase, partial [Elizabethkingia argentiflava]|nr:nicotinate phosphoribosyltransferase [Elizabethkingia argenteiflava]
MLEYYKRARLFSIFDNDFYKLTMQCAVTKIFPRQVVKYEFINRGKHIYPEGFADELSKAIKEMSKLKLSPE